MLAAVIRDAVFLSVYRTTRHSLGDREVVRPRLLKLDLIKGRGLHSLGRCRGRIGRHCYAFLARLDLRKRELKAIFRPLAFTVRQRLRYLKLLLYRCRRILVRDRQAVCLAILHFRHYQCALAVVCYLYGYSLRRSVIRDAVFLPVYRITRHGFCDRERIRPSLAELDLAECDGRLCLRRILLLIVREGRAFLFSAAQRELKPGCRPFTACQFLRRLKRLLHRLRAVRVRDSQALCLAILDLFDLQPACAVVLHLDRYSLRRSVIRDAVFLPVYRITRHGFCDRKRIGPGLAEADHAKLRGLCIFRRYDRYHFRHRHAVLCSPLRKRELEPFCRPLPVTIRHSLRYLKLLRRSGCVIGIRYRQRFRTVVLHVTDNQRTLVVVFHCYHNNVLAAVIRDAVFLSVYRTTRHSLGDREVVRPRLLKLDLIKGRGLHSLGRCRGRIGRHCYAFLARLDLRKRELKAIFRPLAFTVRQRLRYLKLLLYRCRRILVRDRQAVCLAILHFRHYQCALAVVCYLYGYSLRRSVIRDAVFLPVYRITRHGFCDRERIRPSLAELDLAECDGRLCLRRILLLIVREGRAFLFSAAQRELKPGCRPFTACQFLRRLKRLLHRLRAVRVRDSQALCLAILDLFDLQPACAVVLHLDRYSLRRRIISNPRNIAVTLSDLEGVRAYSRELDRVEGHRRVVLRRYLHRRLGHGHAVLGAILAQRELKPVGIVPLTPTQGLRYTDLSFRCTAFVRNGCNARSIRICFDQSLYVSNCFSYCD